MVQRSILVFALIQALCLMSPAADERSAWQSYLSALRERGLAMQMLNTNRNALAVCTDIRINLGTNTYTTTWTNGTGVAAVVKSVTSYALTSTVLKATNMVAMTPSNLLAQFGFLQAVYTQNYVSADILAQADQELFALIDSGLWVDTNAIARAGGWSNYFASYTSTNWYWVDTDGLATTIIGSNYISGDTWWSFPQHPTTLPRLTREEAWKAAGIEPLLTSEYVATNTPIGDVFGYQTGELNSLYASVTNAEVVTNRGFRYVFPRAPTNVTYRAEIAQGRIVSIGQHVETNVLNGTTNIVTCWTTALQLVSTPASVPQQYLHPRLWTNGGTRAYFSLPESTNQLPPNISFQVAGSVPVYFVPAWSNWVDSWDGRVITNFSLTTQSNATSTVQWVKASNGVAVANFYRVDTITSDYRVVERSDETNRYLGATVSIVYTNTIATAGLWDDFRSPITADALSNRVKILSQLTVMAPPVYNTQMVSWSYFETKGQPTNIDFAYWKTVSYGVATEWGEVPSDPLCDVTDGLSPFTVGNKTNSVFAPGGFAADAEIQCEDFVEHREGSDSGEYWLDHSESHSIWVNVENNPPYPINVTITLTNLSTNLAFDVKMIGSVTRNYADGQGDRIGHGPCSDYIEDRYWPYDDWEDAGWYLCFEDTFVPDSAPNGFSMTMWDYSDTNENCEIQWHPYTRMTNLSSGYGWLPEATNQLRMVWESAKSTVQSVIVSDPISIWPTQPPPAPPFIAEAMISHSKSEADTNCWAEGSIVHHVRTAKMTPNSEQAARRIENLQLLFFFNFTEP